MDRKNIIQQIFYEKYRPTTFDEYIAPPELQEMIESWKSGELNHIILESVSGGTGKSTLVKLLIEYHKASYLWLNSQINSSIDVIRTRVTDFVLTRSKSHYKYVVLDEADGLSSEAQKALRGTLEDFGKNRSVRFIFTCNNYNKIDPYIQSRCQHVNFDNILLNNKKYYCTHLMVKLIQVCEENNIPYDKVLLARLISAKFPDMRKIYVTISENRSGITAEKFHDISDEIHEALQNAKHGNFSEVRKFIQNHQFLANDILSTIYSNVDKYFIKDIKAANGIVALASCQSSLRDSVDHRIPLCALFIDLAQIGCIA